MSALQRPVRRSGGTRKAVLRHLASVALTLTVVGARVALDPLLGRQNNRHIVLLPGVMLASWIGGFWAGAAATAIDAVALETLFRSSSPVGIPAAGDLVLFVAVALAVAGIVESLLAARARADASRDARDHILAIVAHDLSNPLNLIRLATAALQRTGPDPSSVKRRLATIDRAVDRMDRLIRDLVDATRIEHEELSIHLGDEPLAAMLRELGESFAPVAKERGIELAIDAASPVVSVRADRARLTQVFGNLLGNALKFTPRGGHVALRVREGDAEVRFDVADSGPGIAPEDLPYVFDRYWTGAARSSASGAGGGTGLGLFIARSIVAAHGGSLEVTSRLGEGATFSFAIGRGRQGGAGGRTDGADGADGADGGGQADESDGSSGQAGVGPGLAPADSSSSAGSVGMKDAQGVASSSGR